MQFIPLKLTINAISCIIIVVVFLIFLRFALKIRLCIDKSIYKKSKKNPILHKYEKNNSKVLRALKDQYNKTFNVETEIGKRTNIPAYEVFNEYSVCKEYGINLRMLDAASGILVGLGLLGTFVGLTMGINGFDSSSSEHIQDSIQGLLEGMSTAFQTSLIGMATSLVYTFLDRLWRHRLGKHLQEISDALDDRYYIDDASLASLNQKKHLIPLYTDIKDFITQQSTTLNSRLIYQTQEGQVVPIGNAVRDILVESRQQSAALKTFSSDLAMELNNSFDETLSRQMQAKILPLMESIDKTTNHVIEHIDQMADRVTAPATDVIRTIVDELNQSLLTITKDFKQGVSSSLTTELDTLAKELGASAQAMSNMPHIMDEMLDSLKITICEVKRNIEEVTQSSTSASSTVIQQMQAQISSATGAISNAIYEIKTVMNRLSETSEEQNTQMVNKLTSAADKMGGFLSGTITKLSTAVENSVKDIAEDMSARQVDLLALQEDTTTETRNLLNSFNTSLDRLEKMNGYIMGTMDMFQRAQGQISGSTAHLQALTGDIKSATQLYQRSQADYNMKMEEIQRNSQHIIDTVNILIKESGEVSREYAEKFEVIKQGLGHIFDQLQNGLTEYSRTVQGSTQKYLDLYSTSLTNTTDALSSTIQQQNEVVEMLVESLNNRKQV